MKTKNKLKEVKVVAYGVFWKKEVRHIYSISMKDNPVIGAQTEITYRVRIPKTMRFRVNPLWADYAFFKSKKDAEIFRSQNNDWEVRPVKINYNFEF